MTSGRGSTCTRLEGEETITTDPFVISTRIASAPRRFGARNVSANAPAARRTSDACVTRRQRPCSRAINTARAARGTVTTLPLTRTDELTNTVPGALTTRCGRDRASAEEANAEHNTAASATAPSIQYQPPVRR